MQARMILVTATAAFCAVGGTLFTRSRPHSTYHEYPEAWQFFPEGLSSIIINGKARGKIVVVPSGQTIDQVQERNTLFLDGDGSTNTVKVTIPTTTQWTSVAPFTLKTGQKRELRNAKGGLIATIYLLRFTPAEERKLQEDQRYRKQKEEVLQRMVELYQNSSTISMDSSQNSFLGGLQMPGLVVWTEQRTVMRDPDDKVKDLESQGFAWKMLGHARVTMTLNTDPRHPNYIRGFVSKNQPLENGQWAQAQELMPLIPARTTTPKIYWFQATPGGERTPSDHQIGKYLLDSHGAWKTVRRSGEFTGYGKHVVNGPDGKPQLILEVSPL
ncbi:hypothetical protein [Armatimonas sp.]|uniref:hypothetical protein n=1 Tax=Armatimonas sp. TaxID=1872638 RepID=UPI00286CCE0D|nr:hypothetical protein [Armatimonas sp.]